MGAIGVAVLAIAGTLRVRRRAQRRPAPDRWLDHTTSQAVPFTLSARLVGDWIVAERHFG
jgi:hypothetical protein